MTSCPGLPTRLALAALLAPAAALLAPAAALLAPAAAQCATAAAPAPMPVSKGSVVRIDLSRVPQRVTLRGTALCTGSRIDATGTQQEVPCQQPFTFDGPFPGDPVVLVFQPAGGGRPTRLEYPMAYDARPKTFTAPSAGTLVQPGPVGKLPTGQVPMPPDLLARAREAGANACGQCSGPGRFTFRDVKIEPADVPASRVEITVLPPGTAP